MTTLEMIAEWRRGCSDTTPDHPEDCKQCTLGLIAAIESHERKKYSTGSSYAIYENGCLVGGGGGNIPGFEIKS